MAVAFKIVVKAIGCRNCTVVVRKCNPCTRGCSCHLQVVRIQFLVFFPWVFSKEIIVRTFMCKARVHRYNRIEENLEVRLCISRAVCGDSAGKVPSCRGAHYSHFLNINIPCLCICTNKAYGCLRILNRHTVVAIRHTVMEYDGCYSHIVEERSPVKAFVVHGEMAVSSSRAYHHSLSVCKLLLRKEYLHPCGVFFVSVTVRGLFLPKVYSCSLILVFCCHGVGNCSKHKNGE